MNLDLSIISDVVHKECNIKYYSSLLQGIQQEAEKIGIVFNQKKSKLGFNDLNFNVKRKLEITFTLCRIRFLFPKMTHSRAVDWVLDDIETGYSERFLCEIFEALNTENVYLHYCNTLDESSFDEKSYIDSQIENYLKISDAPLKKIEPDFIENLAKELEIDLK